MVRDMRAARSRQRAAVKDEGATYPRWSVYIESEYGAGSTMAARFYRRAVAERIAAALNRAYETEGRLWEPRWED